ncbi:twin-arginine translocase subunit TatC [Sulfobacillus thermotolerans]|uniref:twin-arginine translocase subunit TatC n=1 Tax=Sulfobacillus thermotolerans TaxID=338644 RepID=UPI0011AF5433
MRRSTLHKSTGKREAPGIILAIFWKQLLQDILWPWSWTHIPNVHGGLTHPALLTLSPTEPFFTVINVVLTVALLLTSPVWMYEIWMYLNPILPPAHRRWVGWALFTALILFWIGVAFTFAILIPASLRFLMTFAASVFTESLRAGPYLSFVTTFSLAFGVLFTVPAWLGITVKLGWLRIEQLRRGRRFALFASAVLAAAIVPSQDPLTLMAAILPVYGLYEITIQLSRWIRPL